MMVSWRNPLASDTDGIDTATWDDYLRHGVLRALDVAGSITRNKQVNALGFCVGGTLLASALALAKRSEEHTSELQSLMRISYAVFCLKKKKSSYHSLTQQY